MSDRRAPPPDWKPADDKEQLRDEIEKQTQEFLKRGGKITKLGKYNTVEELKEKYRVDNTGKLLSDEN